MLRKSTLAGIGIALIGGGIGLGVIGITLGARTGISIGPDGINVGKRFVETISSQGNNRTNSGNRQIVEHETLQPFETMELQIGVADVEVVAGTDYSISADLSQELAVDYEVRGDKLYVKQKNKHMGFNIGDIGWGNQLSGNITITIPVDAKLGDNYFDTGVGDWWIDNLKMGNLKMNIGVGNVKLSNMEVADLEVFGGVGGTSITDVTSQTMKITGGVGDIEGTGITTKDLEAEAGVGEIDLEGDFQGDIYATGGMGDFNLTTTVPEQDYNYKIEKGVGTITINDRKVSGLDDYTQHNGGKYEMYVECGVGDIDITTNK